MLELKFPVKLEDLTDPLDLSILKIVELINNCCECEQDQMTIFDLQGSYYEILKIN